MKKIYFTILVLIFLFGIVSAQSKISSDVLNKIDSQKSVKVIVTLKDSGKNTMKTLSDKKEFLSGGYEAELTETQINSLAKDDNVLFIEPVRNFKIALQDSTPLIKATNSWQLQTLGLNLTGIKQTVCVLDTGINFSHGDLTGRNLTCNIYCNPNGDACQEDCSVGDLNGHGTHVAGIVGASGGISGIAPAVNLIGIKVFSGSSSTDATTSSIKNGIDWCINNAESYNISVITMSLGTDITYMNYCDSDSPTLNTSINNANNKNISVTVASGNGNPGNSSGISLPACIPNAIPVSATDKSDVIASYSNRNWIVKLFAPGTSINSTNYAGGYQVLSGTSMATPIIAGGIAIINEMLNLTNQKKTPKQIETILWQTGNSISDSQNASQNFSRIDIYAAVLSLDNIVPNVSLIYPENNSINLSQNKTFICNSSDWQLANVSFYLWNSSSLVYNETKNISGILNQTSFSVNNLAYNNYQWNCNAIDVKSNSYSSGNFSLSVGGIETTLASPTNNSYTNTSNTNFSCSSLSATNELVNVTFYLWNSSSLVYNETKNISGLSNTTNFSFSFLNEESYNWTCKGVNNATNSSSANNFTISYDITSPIVNLILPLPTDEDSNSASKAFLFNVSENSSCSLIINNVVNQTSTFIANTSSNFTQSFAPGSYSWSINCSDSAGNSNNTSQNSFTITTPCSGCDCTNSCGGGGGGGGGGGSFNRIVTQISNEIHNVSSTELANGYHGELKASDKIKFLIFDEKYESHEILIDSISPNSVELTIRSDPIKVILGIGQGKKINLTSENYYNLYIYLENITNGKANITIQSINEQMTPINNIINQTIVVESADNKASKDYLMLVIFISIIIICIVAFIIYLIERRIEKRKEREITQKWKLKLQKN